MSNWPAWLQFITIFLIGYVPCMLIFRWIDRKEKLRLNEKK